jgi:hypothetical protein
VGRRRDLAGNTSIAHTSEKNQLLKTFIFAQNLPESPRIALIYKVTLENGSICE